MVYIHNQTALKEYVSKKSKVLIAAALASVIVIAVAATSFALPASGPGKVTVGVDASTWTSNSPTGPGLIPIGGSGQVNGEFTTAERNGVVIGLRAQERFFGPYEVTPNENGKVGIYNSVTGESSANSAVWNYDWHVDLRNAKGVFANKTLADFDLTLKSDIGLPDNFDLTFGGVTGQAKLYQQSFNPKFFNPSFNVDEANTYNLQLVLTPKTFNGAPLMVSIQVNVESAE